MRLISNHESVAKGEVSVLAIVETLFAISLVFYFSEHFNTLRWLAVAMCVAPLLLLRTEESTRLGIECFNRFAENTPNSIKIFPISLLLVIYISLIAFAVRVSATLVSALRSPVESLQVIPKKWSRIILTVDSLFPPELIPDHKEATLKEVIKLFSEYPKNENRLKAVLAIPVCFIPALVYRWSVKATSIIYAPLVFVAYSTFSKGTDLRTKLELIKRGDLSRIRALYGVVVIVAFLVKLVLMMKWNGFVDIWKGNPITEFLSLYIVPTEIPKWQIAEVANSVLAVSAMVFARYALLRYEPNHTLPEKPVKQILGFVSGVRWVLAIYAIVCLGYITMREAHNWHWPALGTKWLPFL